MATFDQGFGFSRFGDFILKGVWVSHEVGLGDLIDVKGFLHILQGGF